MDRHRVTGSLVRNAAAEVFGKRFTPHWLPWVGTAAAAALLVTTTVLLWNFRPWSSASHAAAATPAGTAITAAATPAAATARHDNVAEIARPEGTTGAGSGSLMPVTAKTPTGASRLALSGHELTELLPKHAAETDPDSAFSKLFGLWRIQYVPAGVDPCTQASNQGLECLNQRGSFGQLRLYNRPAILILNDDTGVSHQVVLTALDDEHASILLGGASHDVSIGELSRYWFGDFVMLWRPGTSQVKSLSQGMRGDDVRWLRQSLQRVEGARSDGPVSDVFDADLGKLVRDFQRQHRLTVDGIAGVQTQIVLASAVAPADSPFLYLADAHGG